MVDAKTPPLSSHRELLAGYQDYRIVMSTRESCKSQLDSLTGTSLEVRMHNATAPPYRPSPVLLLALLHACGGSGAALEPDPSGPGSTSSLPVDASSSADSTEASSSATDSVGPPTFVPDPSWERREVRFPDYALPAEETTYACASTSFALEQLEHVVAFEAVIDNPQNVHHMILGVGPEPIDGVVPCYPSAPGVLMQWGWAPGLQPLELPAEAGVLIGDAPGGEVHYVLQIHYSNPGLHEGVVDASGINLYTTRELRQHRASVFSVGDVAGLAIPGGQEAFETIQYCSGEATSLFFVEPVHVYGSRLHAHRLGEALWTEQRRDGVSLGELGRSDPYDFDLQYVQPLQASIEPGDELVTHCIYDSSSRTEPTLGGDASDDEMCLNYLFHYPALPFSPHCND